MSATTEQPEMLAMAEEEASAMAARWLEDFPNAKAQWRIEDGGKLVVRVALDGEDE